MSPEAIDQRLDMVSALYDLGKYLQSARPVCNPEDAEQELETTTGKKLNQS